MVMMMMVAFRYNIALFSALEQTRSDFVACDFK